MVWGKDERWGVRVQLRVQHKDQYCGVPGFVSRGTSTGIAVESTVLEYLELGI